MRSFTLTDPRNWQGEVFDQAPSEPKMLTKQSCPSHVILSAQTYEFLIDRLYRFEDGILRQVAEKEIQQLLGLLIDT